MSIGRIRRSHTETTLFARDVGDEINTPPPTMSLNRKDTCTSRPPAPVDSLTLNLDSQVYFLPADGILANSAGGRRQSRPKMNGLLRRSCRTSALLASAPVTPRCGGRSQQQIEEQQPREDGRREQLDLSYISNMRWPDSAGVLPLADYHVVVDHWRQAWNDPVQVVKASSELLPHAIVSPSRKREQQELNSAVAAAFSSPSPFKNRCYNKKNHKKFRMPRKFVKLADVRIDEESLCWYDMDVVDVAWLTEENRRRADGGMRPITELQVERTLEWLENRCYRALNTALSAPCRDAACFSGRETNDDTVCDVCLSPHSDEGNEIVFCDGCDVCVHQSCYGIWPIPQDQWLCRSCSVLPGRPPQCVLCPMKGGALKCTRNGLQWAHVICVWYIPDVKFDDPEYVEPIINLSKIPEDVWALNCSTCKVKGGCCTQCSYKSCRTAYHVTCAQKLGLEMTYKPNQQNVDDIVLESFCQRHSSGLRMGGLFDRTRRDSGRYSDGRTSAEPAQQQRFTAVESIHRSSTVFQETPSRRRVRRQLALATKFFAHVPAHELYEAAELSSVGFQVPQDARMSIYEYWKLKRWRKKNRPLMCQRVSASCDDSQSQAHLLEKQLREKIKKMLAIRTNLEKARNLCYMLERREKLKREIARQKERIFECAAKNPVDDRAVVIVSAGFLLDSPPSSSAKYEFEQSKNSSTTTAEPPSLNHGEVKRVKEEQFLPEEQLSNSEQKPVNVDERDQNFNLTPELGQMVDDNANVHVVSPPTGLEEEKMSPDDEADEMEPRTANLRKRRTSVGQQDESSKRLQSPKSGRRRLPLRKSRAFVSPYS